MLKGRVNSNVCLNFKLFTNSYPESFCNHCVILTGSVPEMAWEKERAEKTKRELDDSEGKETDSISMWIFDQ